MITGAYTVSFCLLLASGVDPTAAQVLRSETPRGRDPEMTALRASQQVRDLEADTDGIVGGLDSIFNSLPTPTASPVTSPVTASPVTATPVSFPTTAAPVTQGPTVTGFIPTDPPSSAPAGTAIIPTQSPTATDCGMPEDDRIAAILARLDAVADPNLIRDESHPQGLATSWLIQETGQFRVCPDDDYCTLEQRWVMAVIYFSTNGDGWFQCSANPNATDLCGSDEPFVGDSRFLSDTSECDWAGISCLQGCVTEIEFEANNLVGTIATEIGLLPNLRIWGMERGGLTGSIPTQIGNLSNLIFIDLDFNAITGSLSSELLSLSALTQLDLNNNQMTGSINGIGVFPKLEFLQLHSNFFTGTVPESLGESTKLAAFTLHQTGITGTMPDSICNLLASEGQGGILTSLIADCSPPNPDIVCDCCTDCRRS